VDKQNHRFADSAIRAAASSRKPAVETEDLGSLGGDYARDEHRGGLGDEYARDGGFSGGGNHDDVARDPDSIRPLEPIVPPSIDPTPDPDDDQQPH
jgi:hypothetical protein